MAIDLFSHRNGCCTKADEIKQKTIISLKEEAQKIADIHMSNEDALQNTLILIDEGVSMFEKEFRDHYRDADPRLGRLINILVASNRRYFTSDFFYNQELQNILQGKVIPIT